MNELNDSNIFLLDIFVLNYYGILVFFQVCKTTEKSVFLVELATKRYKNGIMLTKRLRTSKNPYIILTNNTHTKSDYEVYPSRMGLPIEITYGSKLHREAEKINGFAITGTFYAVHCWDYLNKYWVSSEKIDKNGNWA